MEGWRIITDNERGQYPVAGVLPDDMLPRVQQQDM